MLIVVREKSNYKIPNAGSQIYINMCRDKRRRTLKILITYLWTAK